MVSLKIMYRNFIPLAGADFLASTHFFSGFDPEAIVSKLYD